MDKAINPIEAEQRRLNNGIICPLEYPLFSSIKWPLIVFQRLKFPSFTKLQPLPTTFRQLPIRYRSWSRDQIL
jgi:hypothetical protein